jgi:hypothetical protein
MPVFSTIYVHLPIYATKRNDYYKCMHHYDFRLVWEMHPYRGNPGERGEPGRANEQLRKPGEPATFGHFARFRAFCLNIDILPEMQYIDDRCLVHPRNRNSAMRLKLGFWGARPANKTIHILCNNLKNAGKWTMFSKVFKSQKCKLFVDNELWC